MKLYKFRISNEAKYFLLSIALIVSYIIHKYIVHYTTWYSSLHHQTEQQLIEGVYKGTTLLLVLFILIILIPEAFKKSK